MKAKERGRDVEGLSTNRLIAESYRLKSNSFISIYSQSSTAIETDQSLPNHCLRVDSSKEVADWILELLERESTTLFPSTKGEVAALPSPLEDPENGRPATPTASSSGAGGTSWRVPG